MAYFLWTATILLSNIPLHTVTSFRAFCKVMRIRKKAEKAVKKLCPLFGLHASVWPS